MIKNIIPFPHIGIKMVDYNQTIVLKGFRQNVTLSDLCGREVIKPVVFYLWTKEFMESADMGD